MVIVKISIMIGRIIALYDEKKVSIIFFYEGRKKGDKRVSNSRPPESQSGALTN